MGEVYRARDSRLGREVAIKILPAAVASDPERLARFKREAHVLASLNHPNIAAIYGFETDGTRDALVLELVEGPTLADRIGRGRLPVPEALEIARQIADALAAAHDAGVVHRDLKPANVKVRDDGVVKVLDFGLAKITEAGRATAASSAQSPTITTPAMTSTGIILGTAAYMSPEQAKGKAADRRSDIWAFGCVLYEMLTGRRAFRGDDVSDTLAAVLRSEPDWDALGSETPAGVRRVLRRCLEKDPGRRYHAIADARLDLTEPSAAAPVDAKAWSRGRLIERAVWTLLAASLLGAIAYVGRRAPAASPPVVRFQIPPTENGFFGALGGIAGGMSGATISPDGTTLAFVATEQSGRTSLWVRPLDGRLARSLAGTDDASMPFWSPDGQSAWFLCRREVEDRRSVVRLDPRGCRRCSRPWRVVEHERHHPLQPWNPAGTRPCLRRRRRRHGHSGLERQSRTPARRDRRPAPVAALPARRTPLHLLESGARRRWPSRPDGRVRRPRLFASPSGSQRHRRCGEPAGHFCSLRAAGRSCSSRSI